MSAIAAKPVVRSVDCTLPKLNHF
jgi:hypothetical protein